METAYLSANFENGELTFKEHVDKHNYYTKILVYTKHGIRVVGDSKFEERVYNDSKVYTFGDFEVFIPPKSTRKLICRRKTDGAVIWEFHFTAYLYTEIIEYEGVLYFGTSGWGGHFYGLDLKDGSLVLDINTHGTEAFSLYRGKLYLISAQGDLLLYNPKNKSSEEFSIAKDIDFHLGTEFLIEENRLYALAGKRPKKDLQISEYFVACIDVT